MIHEMHLRETPFKEIKSGVKTVEVRLGDEKRKRIKKGDEICFDCDGEKIFAEVAELFRFDSFSALFASDLKDKCGMAELSAEERAEKMSEYYSKEDEEKYGVLAIELRLANN